MSVRVTVIVTALGIGGAEHALLKLLTHIDRTRFEVSVIVLGQEDALLPQYQAAGIEPVMLRMNPGRWPIQTARRLVAAVRALSPDILQGWMYHGNLAASFAAERLEHRPAVCWSVRDTPDAAHGHSLFTRAVIRISGWYARRVDRIFNVSSLSAAYCSEHFGWPAACTEVLPNGIDTARFRPDPLVRDRTRQSLGVGVEPLIGIIARWSPVKNHALFLDAAALLAQRRPDARFVLVGKGLDADNAELATMLAQHHLSERVLLLGPRHDVEQVYPALDIVALTSRSEGFPNVLAEAMACGVPVTSTDVGDAQAIIGGGGRVLPASAEAFAESWSEWLADQTRRDALSVAAREHIADRYALDALVERLQERYAELAYERASNRARAALPL